MCSGAAVFFMRVDDAHREYVLRVLIRLLAGIEDLEFVLRKIVHRIMGLVVARDYIKDHFAGSLAEDKWLVGGTGGGRGLLRGHRKADRKDEAGRSEKKVVLTVVPEHGGNFIAHGEGLGRGNPKGATPKSAASETEDDSRAEANVVLVVVGAVGQERQQVVGLGGSQRQVV